jgi:hypothetical protein
MICLPITALTKIKAIIAWQGSSDGNMANALPLPYCFSCIQRFSM